MIIVIIEKLFVIFTNILIHSMNVNINKQDSNKGLIYIISNRIKHVVIKGKRVGGTFERNLYLPGSF